MISLTCTSCKKVLEIDDAFAGGVCRCQHCGTIQTVPSSLKKVIRPGSPGVGAKTLYQRTGGTSTGVASPPAKSAAAPAAPAKTRAAAPQITTLPARRPLLPIVIGAVAAVIIAIVGALFALKHLHN
jgi:hypothetical protein